MILIREKLSRLSPQIKLDHSIAMQLEYQSKNEKVNETISSVKKVELKALMDPGALAE